MALPRILITPGEPAGIGPELTVRVAQKAYDASLIAVCDPTLLADSAKRLGLPLTIHTLTENAPSERFPAGHIGVLPVSLGAPNEPGQLNTANARYVIETLQIANDRCLSGWAHAIVTGPVQKSVINDAGIAFSGHTEFFAEQSHTPKVVMMLATEGLRVALVTTHLPLREVADAITRDEVLQVTRILHSEMQTKFGLTAPRILVCGINPHAGEGGHLGREELDTLIPALEQLRGEGMDLQGPLPADTLFNEKYLKDADAVLAMYHDQGLPVLKFKGFGRAMNITLGLPYIRTSVDHGTALDLAGKGIADAGSFDVALNEAIALAATH